MAGKWETTAQGPEDLTDGQLGCRVERHDFARLRPGQPIPKTVDVRRSPDGWYEVSKPCKFCGAELYTEEYKGDVRVRRIIYPDDWKRIPRSAGIRKHEIRSEYAGRLADDLARAAK